MRGLLLLSVVWIGLGGALWAQGSGGYVRHTLGKWGSVEIPNGFKRAAGDALRLSDGIPDGQENSPEYAHLKGALFIFIPKTLYTPQQRDVIVLRVEVSRGDLGDYPTRNATASEMAEMLEFFNGEYREIVEEMIDETGGSLISWRRAKVYKRGSMLHSFVSSDPDLGEQEMRVMTQYDYDCMITLSATASPEVMRRYSKGIAHFFDSFRLASR